MTNNSPALHDNGEYAAAAGRLRRMERRLIAAAFVIGAVFVLLLLAVKWPRYWEYIASEQTPMTWLQSVVWFGCGLLALLSLTLVYARRGFRLEAAVWLLLAGACFFLMADERFALHERVRDHWLKPADIRLLPWMGAGDFVILLYAVVALCFLVYIYRVFKVRKAAWIWFCIAAGLAAAAVVMDSFDVSRMSKDAERLEQTLEEIVELTSVLALLSAKLLMLNHNLMAWATPDSNVSGPAAADGTAETARRPL
ncbi:hypothetical protein [Paenibacillus spongiae]|uniref:Uncharacterized protein n=1 Tax=Paenibacillus spongiae TaxID=2909671 RepID=A0ABY5S9V7_9BACL|nr:hypothetical protein [Paenibacillus spongiae]UVI30726.1 hypothetical protein L1F29_02255 [Paenibacillus spongiae]